MEQLNSAKQVYLLNASPEILHEESREWLADMEFWKDEIAFLYTLFVSVTRKSVPVSSRLLLQKLENELVLMSSGELEAMMEKVSGHERDLALLVEKADREAGERYRRKHSELSVQIKKFSDNLLNVKRQIFGLFKGRQLEI